MRRHEDRTILPFALARGGVFVAAAATLVLMGEGKPGWKGALALLFCTTSIAGSAIVTTGLEGLALRRCGRYPGWLPPAIWAACAIWHTSSCVHTNVLLHLARSGSVRQAVVAVASPSYPIPGGRVSWELEAAFLVALVLWLLNFVLMSALRMRAPWGQVAGILGVYALGWSGIAWAIRPPIGILLGAFLPFVVIFGLQLLADLLVVRITGRPYPRFARCRPVGLQARATRRG